MFQVLINQKNTRKIIAATALLVFLFVMFIPVYNAQAFSKPIVPKNCLGNDIPNTCHLSDFIVLISNIIFFLIENILLPVAVISFAWAGWLYLTAGGNPSQIEEAHKIFKYIIIGLLLALGAWLIVNAILDALLDPKATSDFNWLV